MSNNDTLFFSLGTKLNWKVSSNDSVWRVENINEFKLSHTVSSSPKLDFEVKQIGQLKIKADALIVSSNVVCSTNELIVIDDITNKKLGIVYNKSGYSIFVEQGYSFFKYAAILDGFIKLLAFGKGIISLHASSVLLNNKVLVFGSWRRVGKSTLLLNLLRHNNDVQILADDAVFVTKEGDIIPYLRGIDLYPYLPISSRYLSAKEKGQRIAAKIMTKIPLLPKKVTSKIIKKFFLPRVNLARFITPQSMVSEPQTLYMVNRGTHSKSVINKTSPDFSKSFFGKSSYFEMIEYQAMIDMLCSKYPDSPFADLLVEYKEFQGCVDKALAHCDELYELSISNDYSDLKELSKRIFYVS